MKRREPTLEPELEAFLNPRSVERRAPPEVRARALARVRAIAAAGGQIPPNASLALAPPPLARPASSHGLVRIVLPASFAAAAVVAVGTVAVLRVPAARAPTPATSAQPVAVVFQPAEVSSLLPPAATPPVMAPPKAVRSVRPIGEAGTTELELLGRAQAAYTQRDFSRALGLLGEANRRFPNGHLAEEREALRVRSLMGAGRAVEGQRAAAAFAVRFPRSVLLSKERKP